MEYVLKAITFKVIGINTGKQVMKPVKTRPTLGI